MKLLFSLVVVSLLLLSCNRTGNREGEGNAPLVKVAGRTLYRGDLEKMLPPDFSEEDSLIIAEHQIRNWINDILLYDVASRNSDNRGEIEQLVESYRKSLIIYQYQEKLINEKLVREIDDATIEAYYEENKDKFRLDRPLIKGLFLRVPLAASHMNDIKSWYKVINPENIENLEKFCILNGCTFDYFVDRWVDFSDLEDSWPVAYKDEVSVIKYNKHLEAQDSIYCYFLNIAEYLLPGDNIPFEHSKAIIQGIVLNQRKVEFLKKTEEELFERALAKGQIQFYD